MAFLDQRVLQRDMLLSKDLAQRRELASTIAEDTRTITENIEAFGKRSLLKNEQDTLVQFKTARARYLQLREALDRGGRRGQD